MFREDCFLLGTLTKVHGLNGELNLVFKNESSFDYEHLESVFIEIDGKLVPFFVDTYRPKDKENCLISFEDIEDEEQALEIKDCDLYAEIIDKPYTETEANFQLGNLVGYELFNQDKSLGKIVDIESYTNNEQFVVEINSTETLIPANEELITNISHEEKKVTMNLPEGLLDIN